MAITTGAYLSRYDEVLKTYYLPAIQETLNNDTILASMIDVNEEDISGKDATIEIHYGRNSGTGARADGGALPSAGYQQFKTATVPTKYQYGQVRFTGPTVAATRDDKGAYARVIDTEIKGIVRDLKKEVNRQLWGCGYGTLARWQSATTTAVVVEKSYSGATNGSGFGSTFGGKYLKENGAAVLVSINSMATAAQTDFTVSTTSMAVTAVDSTSSTTADTLTNSDPGAPTEGDWFVRPASLRTVLHTSTAGYGRLEMMGIRGIATNTDLSQIACYDDSNGAVEMANDDALQGLDADTYTWWQAIVDSTSTRYGAQRALTFRLMQKMFDQVEENAGRNYGPDLILTTRAIRREYLELCRADRRAVNTMSLDGGWEALDYNGVPLMVDNDAIDGEMYFLTTKDLQIYRMSDYDWMEKDGSVLHRVTGYDAYDATLFRYAELGCQRRNSQGVLCDLNYTL